MLAWVFARCAGHGAAPGDPDRLIPPVGVEGIDTRGVDVSDEHVAELLRVDVAEWRAQLPQFHEHYAKFEHLPASCTPSCGRSKSAWPSAPRSPSARARPLGAARSFVLTRGRGLRRPRPAGATPRPAR